MVEITIEKLDKIIEKIDKEIKEMLKDDISETEKILNNLAESLMGISPNLKTHKDLENYMKCIQWKSHIEMLKATIMFLEKIEEDE